MSLQNAKRRVLRNLWTSTLLGFIGTFVAAFAVRFTAYAWLLLPYGIDDPFAPLFAIIRNSFWIFLALVAISLFRPGRVRTEALPAFLLNVQVLVGEIISVFLFSAWHSLALPGEQSIPVLLYLTSAGQVVAYLGRKQLFPES
jgi:hypothetical protein